MSLARKRRSQADASADEPPARRRRHSASVSEASIANGSGDEATGSGTHEQMVKKLVRLALACEFSRQPLRRADISAKVLGPSASRSFKSVFESAQQILLTTFGMTLTELPIKEKITISQKRQAQRANGNSQGAAASSKAYILTSTLPSALRKHDIIPPTKIPSAGAEAAYTALYTFIIGVIYLSQGARCSESKLEKALDKVNAGDYVLGEKTDKILKRLEKEGYIVKVKEREAGGEETIEWVVGPRGKVEVGESGVAGLVLGVYGKKDAEVEDLEQRLEKSLGKGTFRKKGGRRRADDEEEEENEGTGEGRATQNNRQAVEEPRSQRRVSARQARRRPDDSEDDDEDDGEEEDGEEEDEEEDDDDDDDDE